MSTSTGGTSQTTQTSQAQPTPLPESQVSGTIDMNSFGAAVQEPEVVVVTNAEGEEVGRTTTKGKNFDLNAKTTSEKGGYHLVEFLAKDGGIVGKAIVSFKPGEKVSTRADASSTLVAALISITAAGIGEEALEQALKFKEKIDKMPPEVIQAALEDMRSVSDPNLSYLEWEALVRGREGIRKVFELLEGGNS